MQIPVHNLTKETTNDQNKPIIERRTSIKSYQLQSSGLSDKSTNYSSDYCVVKLRLRVAYLSSKSCFHIELGATKPTRKNSKIQLKNWKMLPKNLNVGDDGFMRLDYIQIQRTINFSEVGFREPWIKTNPKKHFQTISSIWEIIFWSCLYGSKCSKSPTKTNEIYYYMNI